MHKIKSKCCTPREGVIIDNNQLVIKPLGRFHLWPVFS